MSARNYFLALCLSAATLMACEHTSQTKTAPPSESQRASTGFTHYDWLPEPLKDTMDYLANASTDRHFNFYYYFTVDDINRHFYLIDPGLKVIAERLVTNEEALNFIDEQLYDSKVRERGSYAAWDTTYFTKQRQQEDKIDHLPYYERTVFYVLPEDSADFRQLRVAIVEDTTVQSPDKYLGPPDPNMYPAEVVDVPARPMRGMEYFREAIMNRVRKAEVFILYDTGTVEVEFGVWGHHAQSPNLIRGFSTREDTHEAYQTDGEFIKAINSAKVRWHDAQKDGKPVRSLVRITFDVSTLKDSSQRL